MGPPLAELPYLVQLPDCSIECTTLDEAIALVKRLRDEGISEDLPIQDRGSEPSARRGSDPYSLLARALAAVAESGDGGLDSASLATWLGLDGPNAIGPKSKVWRRLIAEELKLDPDSVWESRGIARNHRRWFPGEEIDRALELALERTRGAAG